MSKRSRGQMMLQSFRAKEDAPTSSSAAKGGKGKGKQEIKSPIKKLLESPGVKKMMEETETSSGVAQEVSRLSSCFKTLNSIVATFHKRRKQTSWDSLVESYETISPGSLSINDLTTIMTIWKDAFTVRWQAKTFDAQQNPRSYEMLVEIPSLQTTSQPPSPAKSATTVSSSSSMDVADGVLPQPPLTPAAIMTQRMEIFNARLHTLSAEAAKRKADSLGIVPDHSLLPAQPTIAAPNQNARQDAAAAVHAQIAAHTKGTRSPNTSANSSSSDVAGKVTLEVLRERAIQREAEALEAAERLKRRLVEEEQQRVLHQLPALADALRGLAVRQNRSHLLRKDCVEAIAPALRLTPKQTAQGLDLLGAAVPDFLCLLPAADKVPATVAVNRAAVYKEVRGRVVEYVRSQQQPAGRGRGLGLSG